MTRSTWAEIRRLPRSVWMLVIVASLGYFVDIYDLLLFSIVRLKSLQSLHVPADEMTRAGILLINWQMAGLLIGGVVWGLLGDKRGRLAVLFGSIFLYSAANIANAFVQTVPVYAALRFVAGIGLAGELGAGITLIAEALPTRLRGFGTTLVATVGLFGAVFAGFVGDTLSWRGAYVIGGCLGLLILLLRVGVYESGLFERTREMGVKRGDFRILFRKRELLRKYLAVILIGTPLWYIVGILMTFTPEFAKAFGMEEAPSAGNAVMACYIGLAIGDFASGFLSQWLRSRKQVIFGYMILSCLMIGSFMAYAGESITIYYTFCVLLGVAAGYWAMFVTVAAEQFGTNIRATVTTTVPNVVRGMVIPLTLGFDFLNQKMGVIASGSLIGVIVMAIAIVALRWIEETFAKDLDYHEVG